MIKRLVFFAYGLAAYAMFLGSFLYAIAFVGDFGVPATPARADQTVFLRIPLASQTLP